MFIAIIRHTPVWVWGLLGALVALGFSQSRAREVGLRRITTVALLLTALSLGGVFSAFGSFPVALGAWVAGFCAAWVCAGKAVAMHGARWSPSRRALHVPGSWLPLALMLGLFAIKYVAGVSLTLNPTLAGNAIFAGLFSLAYGCVSGLFMARAQSLRAIATRQPPLQTV